MNTMPLALPFVKPTAILGELDPCHDAPESDLATWPAWTDEAAWSLPDDAEPTGPDPLDEAYALGFELGQTDANPHRFRLSPDRSFAEFRAFHNGICDGFLARRYDEHLARIVASWDLVGPNDPMPVVSTAEHLAALQAGLMAEAASPTAPRWDLVRPTGVVDEDVYRPGCSS